MTSDDHPKGREPTVTHFPPLQAADSSADTRKVSTSDDVVEKPGRSSAVASGISPGQVLARRFIVTHFLGSGGMGEVFGAEDQALGERIALKVIRAVGHGSEIDRKRLKREVQLARRVAHRNVCRIYDLNQHHDESTGALFDVVSMELIDGENLSAVLVDGPLPLEVALPIFRQIARGLNAVHSQGIVHRDLKPGNVMLVPEGPGYRVAITDFGLAQQVGGEAAGETVLTQEGRLIGTPAYMAPEQVAGEPISPATDIFSLGLLLYEMLTGRLPFSGASPWHVAISRLTETPTPVSDYLPEIDGHLAAVIHRCLDRLPEDRYPSSVELLADLDDGDSSWNLHGLKTETPGSGAVGPIRVAGPPRWSYKIWSAVVLGVSALAVLAGQWLGPIPDRDLPTWSENVSAKGVGEDGLDAGLSDFPALVENGHRTLNVAEEEVPELQQVLDEASLRLAVQDGPAAVEILSRGLERWPAHPYLEIRLAEALWWSGQDRMALKTATEAMQRLEELDLRMRQFLEALQHGFEGDWILARDIFDGLWRSTGELEFGLWALQAQANSGRVDSLENIVEGLRALPGRQGKDPRIDLWAGRLMRRPADAAQAVELLEGTVTSARRLGLPMLESEALLALIHAHLSVSEDQVANPLVLTNARLVETFENEVLKGYSLLEKAARSWRLGQQEEALLHLDRSIERFEDLESNRGLCQAKLLFGLMPGGFEHRKTRLDEALAHCSEAGFSVYEAVALKRLARLWKRHGDLDKALDLLHQSAALYEDLGDRVGMAQSQMVLAGLLARVGKLEDALARVEGALEWFRVESSQRHLTEGLAIYARLALTAGLVDEASTKLLEMDATRPTGRFLLEMYAVRSKIEYLRNDADGLRRDLRALREHNRLVQDPVYERAIARGEACLATLEGESIRALDLMKSLDAEGEELLQLARLQMAAGRRAEARNTLERFRAASEGDETPEVDWTARMLGAELIAVDAPQNAAARLQRIAEEAAESGYRPIALRAQLARAILLGQRTERQNVAHRARELGLLRLAAQAEPD